MDKKQALVPGSDDFSWCNDKTWLQTDDSKSDSPIQKTDSAIEENLKHALWADDVLRVTDNNEIDVHVKNGIVYMRGHMTNTANRQRVEKVLETISGVHGSRNNLVIDDELMLEVAASLVPLEKIHHCKFFTGVSHGAVVLNGEVSNEKIRLLAEKRAASHPRVRGVINYIRVPGVDLGIQDQRLLQPPIGKEVHFRDGVSGIVQQVVINPDNRRVIAMTIQKHIYDSHRNLALSNNKTVRATEQTMVIPMGAMGYLTENSCFLTIKSTDFNMYQKFDAHLFTVPDRDWAPPYPYCFDDVLFPIKSQQADDQVMNESHQPLSSIK